MTYRRDSRGSTRAWVWGALIVSGLTGWLLLGWGVGDGKAMIAAL